MFSSYISPFWQLFITAHLVCDHVSRFQLCGFYWLHSCCLHSAPPPPIHGWVNVCRLLLSSCLLLAEHLCGLFKMTYIWLYSLRCESRRLVTSRMSDKVRLVQGLFIPSGLTLPSCDQVIFSPVGIWGFVSWFKCSSFNKMNFILCTSFLPCKPGRVSPPSPRRITLLPPRSLDGQQIPLILSYI